MVLFFSKAEMAKITNLQVFSPDFAFAAQNVSGLIEHWLPLFESLKFFRFTILLSPEIDDVFTTWDRGEHVWSVQERLALYNGVARDSIEAVKKIQIAKGIVWEVDFEVESVNAKLEVADGDWTYEL